MFGRRRKKLDPRVRFQHQSFTRKLDQARQYKREPAAIPEDWQGYILTKLGLNTRFSQAMAGLVLIFLIYLVFLPNFLSAKTTKVEGVGEEDAKRVQADVASYLSNSPFFLAQRNLIFLDKSRLTEALLADRKIYRVPKITKHIWSRTVVVTVEMKAPKYLAKRNNVVYSVYNDGTVQEQSAIDPASWLSSSPDKIKLEDSNSDPLYPDNAYLSENFITMIDQIVGRYKDSTNNDINYFAIPPGTSTPLDPEDIIVWVKKPGGKPDYKVLLRSEQNWDEVFAKLELLFAQMPADRYNKLVYVDLRYEQRAFLCLNDAPCAKEPEPEPPPDQPLDESSDSSSPTNQPAPQ